MTAAYIFWALLAIGLWILILTWREGYPCPDKNECTDEESHKIFKEQLIEKMKDDI